MLKVLQVTVIPILTTYTRAHSSSFLLIRKVYSSLDERFDGRRKDKDIYLHHRGLVEKKYSTSVPQTEGNARSCREILSSCLESTRGFHTGELSCRMDEK
jgi:hypothetical protein